MRQGKDSRVSDQFHLLDDALDWTAAVKDAMAAADEAANYPT